MKPGAWISAPTQSCLALFAWLLCLAAPASAQSWLQPTGSFDFDWTGYSGEGALRTATDDFPEDFHVRRARIGVQGELHPQLFYRSTFSVDDSQWEVSDLYLDASSKEGRYRLRIGRFKEGFGLERSTKPVHLGFLERGPATALSPNRNQGMQLRRLLPRTSGAWTVGLFREVSPPTGVRRDGAFADDLDLTTRLVWNNEQQGVGQWLWHAGLSLSLRRPDDGFVRFDAAPAVRGGQDVVDTGLLAADRVQLAALELATRRGAWTLESELLQARVQLSGGESASLPGGTVKLSMAMPGWQRNYRSKQGRFHSLERSDTAAPARAGQPWSLSTRVSWLDLQDGVVIGGRVRTEALGATWFVHQNLAFLAELAHVQVGGEDLWAFGIRLHLDF